MGVALLALIVLLFETGGQTQPAADDLGVSGSVVMPDGTPATSGIVLLYSGFLTSAQPNRATLDRTGSFRIAASQGRQQLLISVPDSAPYRATVTVPASRTMKLPPIQLSRATYFRARLVTADGEQIPSPQLRRQSLDVHGRPIADPPDSRAADQIEDDGSLTIGPLPRGVTTLAVDMTGFALTRLPDLDVNGTDALLNGGTIVLQAGAVLNVDIIDANGSPVPQHTVLLEDAIPLSPLFGRTVRTNAKGRASFDRVGAGRYLLRTPSIEWCNGRQPLSVTRLVTVAGNGALRTRIIVGGTATLRLMSPFGPMRGASVTMSPEVPSQPMPGWLRKQSDFELFMRRPMGFQSPGFCGGTTDAEGRITITNFPPGPSRISVRLLNSTYVRRVSVPDDGKEMVMVIPDGFLPVRVINAAKNGPIVGATVEWRDGAGRVEARTTGNGEALLEGVSGAGTLAITADGFERREEKLQEPPGMLHEVALVPSPPTSLQVQVIDARGVAVRDAVVELNPADALETPEFAATDPKGLIAFFDLPPGGLQLSATAEGYLPAKADVAQDKRQNVVLKLTRRE